MKKILSKGTVFFFIVLISMCSLKLWFTLLLIFGYAIFITLKNRKRNFCSEYCPLGTIQDFGYDNSKPKIAKKENLKKTKILFYILFSAYILFYIFYLYDKPFALWRQMLFLMFFSASAALILQNVFGKRYWCINACPLGSLLGISLKIGKRRG